ncbi:MAG TPA: ribbon-helix-helix domain-containing protein [Caulobacteraceae bacterium]
MSTRVVTAHVPTQLAEKVDDLAAQMDRSRAWIMKQALAEWVEREEEHHRLTLAGLADVEAGRVVAHEAVRAWADSLSTDSPLPLPK